MSENLNQNELTTNTGIENMEDELKKLFLDEFEEMIEKLVTIPESEFMINYTKRTNQAIEEMYSEVDIESENFSKNMKFIQKKIYNDLYLKLKRVITKVYDSHLKLVKNSKGTQKIILNSNFLKHCSFTSECAVHTCGGNFIPVYCNYSKYKETLFEITPHNLANEDFTYKSIGLVICETCKTTYLSNYFETKCHGCNLNYNSFIVDPNLFNLQPATWYKYHCVSMYNGIMKCTNCKKEDFYINLKDDFLECLKCNFVCAPLSIVWTCFKCCEDFSSEAISYNPLIFLPLKKSIKKAIFRKKISKPPIYCCSNAEKSRKHKNCDGNLYEFYIDQKRKLVCGKCEMILEKEIICNSCLRKEKILSIDTHKRHIESEKTNKTSKILNKSSDIHYDENSVRIIGNVMNNKTHRRNSSRTENLNILNDSKIGNPTFESNRGLNMMKYVKIPSTNYLTNDANPQTETEKLNHHISENNDDKNSSKKNLKKFILFSKEDSGENSFRKKEKNPIPPHSGSNKNIKNMTELINNPFRSKDNSNTKIPIVIKDNNMNYKEETKKKTTPIEEMPKAMNEEINFGDVKKSSINLDINFAKMENLVTLQKDTLEKININFSLDGINLSSEIPLFKVEDFKLISSISSKNNSIIYLCADKYNNKFASKKIICDTDPQIIVDTYKKNYEFSHQNILQIHSMIKRQIENEKCLIYILMDLSISDLNSEVNYRADHNLNFSEEEIFKIVQSTTNALSYLQMHKLSHGDIKPQDILFCKDSIKLTEFGRNKPKSLENEESIFYSPELIKHLGDPQFEYDPIKSDIYSLGLCLIYAITLNLSSVDEIKNEPNPNNYFPLIQLIVARYGYSSNLAKIIYRMIDINEDRRYDFIELHREIN